MAVARRKWAGHLGASWAKLARVKKSGDSARIVEAANDCLSLYSSEQRLEKLIHAVADQPPEVFWPVWLNTWSVVDRVADLQPYLPALFKRKGPAHQFFDDGMRAMLEALPGVVTVYRGCDRRFIEGIAWTTDYAVADNTLREADAMDARAIRLSLRARSPRRRPICFMSSSNAMRLKSCASRPSWRSRYSLSWIGPHIVPSKPSKPSFEWLWTEGDRIAGAQRQRCARHTVKTQHGH